MWTADGNWRDWDSSPGKTVCRWKQSNIVLHYFTVITVVCVYLSLKMLKWSDLRAMTLITVRRLSQFRHFRQLALQIALVAIISLWPKRSPRTRMERDAHRWRYWRRNDSRQVGLSSTSGSRATFRHKKIIATQRYLSGVDESGRNEIIGEPVMSVIASSPTTSTFSDSGIQTTVITVK